MQVLPGAEWTLVEVLSNKGEVRATRLAAGAGWEESKIMGEARTLLEWRGFGLRWFSLGGSGEDNGGIGSGLG